MVLRPHVRRAALIAFVISRKECNVVLFVLMQSFAKMFNTTPDDLDMHVIYDVSHNIAKFEEHFVDGKQKTLLVHRKGSTRAFPPHHPLIPVDYQVCLSVNRWQLSFYYQLGFLLNRSEIIDSSVKLVIYTN